MYIKDIYLFIYSFFKYNNTTIQSIINLHFLIYNIKYISIKNYNIFDLNYLLI